MRRKLSNILLILLLTTFSISCATGGASTQEEYDKATNEYNFNATLYKNAGDTIQFLRGDGKVSTTQWNMFQHQASIVRSTDLLVVQNFQEWESTGKKPSAFDSNFHKLKDAQNAVINLSKEVSK